MKFQSTLRVAIALSLITILSCGKGVTQQKASLPSTPSPDSTAPSVGTAISFASVSYTSLTVNWGAATDDQTAAASLKYKLVKSTAAANIDSVTEANAITGADLLLDWTTATISKPVSSLTPATTYYFAVLVKDEAGNMALYTVNTETTLANNAPTPGTLTFENVTDTTVDIGWTAASDDITAPSSLEYKLVRAATIAAIDTVAEADAIVGGNLLVDWTTGTLSFNSIGLLAGNAFAYSLLVRDEQGNTAQTPPLMRAQGKMIYVTAGMHDANFGGVAGADAFCDAAAIASVDQTATVLAMISDNSTRIACGAANCGGGPSGSWVMAANLTYYNANGLAIGTTTADHIFTFPVTNAITTNNRYPVTGLNQDWTSNVSNCGAWTTTTGSTSSGYSPAVSASMVNSFSAINCSDTLYMSLYCVEQ